MRGLYHEKRSNLYRKTFKRNSPVDISPHTEYFIDYTERNFSLVWNAYLKIVSSTAEKHSHAARFHTY